MSMVKSTEIYLFLIEINLVMVGWEETLEIIGGSRVNERLCSRKPELCSPLVQMFIFEKSWATLVLTIDCSSLCPQLGPDKPNCSSE